jgi:hypothetical protein
LDALVELIAPGEQSRDGESGITCGAYLRFGV